MHYCFYYQSVILFGIIGLCRILFRTSIASTHDIILEKIKIIYIHKIYMCYKLKNDKFANAIYVKPLPSIDNLYINEKIFIC